MTSWEKRLAWVFVALLALATAAAAGNAPRVADPLLALGDDADPLAEVNRLRQTLGLPPEPDLRFKENWPFPDDDLSRFWPSLRPSGPSLRTEVQRERDRIVMTFRVPGADQGALAVKSTAEGVFVSFSSVETRKSAAGKVRESRSYAQFVGRPPDAVAGSAKVERRGDAVVVTFKRRAAAPRP